MATLTIDNLPDGVHDRLRAAAARNGRSVEEEACAALSERYPAASQPNCEDIEERVRRVQEAFKPYRKDGVSIVDELIAERRAAAARGE